ncbi:MAG: MATE family efflux transporter, partial [Lachnospiraceae bacterium]|nr:MATE family efflux transporter [Lachnospiraceae bacterium]
IAAVFVNLCLNYLLIYGKLGLPALGGVGAAIATVVSRYVEAAIVIVWTHRHKEKNPYIVGVYSTLKVPGHLAGKFFIKGAPLLINETLWSSGMAMLTQCYSVRGLSVIAGLNIANTLNNVFNVVFIAMGDAVAIIIGQLLGAGKMEEARDTDNKIIAFSVCCCIGVAALMVCIAPLFPQIYNTTDDVKAVAVQFIIAQAIFMPQAAFMHATYFTLRSGGKTIITFLFDSVFVWCVSVPVAYCLSRFTGIPVIAIFAMVQIADWIKCIIGFILVKKGVWLQNIVARG